MERLLEATRRPRIGISGFRRPPEQRPPALGARSRLPGGLIIDCGTGTGRNLDWLAISAA
jgi:hypothetical protein